jgi:hypothetical protein
VKRSPWREPAGLLLLATALAACEKVEEVIVFPGFCGRNLAVGDSIQLQADAYGSGALFFSLLYSSASDPHKFRWSTLNPQTAYFPRAGVLRALAAGDVRIVVETEGFSDTTEMAIVAAQGQVVAEPVLIQISRGETIDLSLHARDDQGNTIPPPDPFQFWVEQVGVAAVQPDLQRPGEQELIGTGRGPVVVHWCAGSRAGMIPARVF